MTPTSWVISSVPSLNFKDDYNDKTGLTSGYHRSRLAWYTIDPLFTRRGSSLTPGHIKSDLKQLSNHYVREVYVKELFLCASRAPIRSHQHPECSQSGLLSIG